MHFAANHDLDLVIWCVDSLHGYGQGFLLRNGSPDVLEEGSRLLAMCRSTAQRQHGGTWEEDMESLLGRWIRRELYILLLVALT